MRTYRFAGLVLAVMAALAADSQVDLRHRARLVEAMSAEEKRELLEQRRRFDALPESERRRLRELYRAIERQPNADALKTVLRHYHRWLLQLPPRERAELLSLPMRERLAQIEKRIREEERQRFYELVNRQLTLKDHEVIHAWLKQVIEARESRLLKAYPKLKNVEGGRRYRILVMLMMRSRFAPSESETRALFEPTEQEWRELAGKLCPKAQEFLRKQPSDATRRKILWKWVHTAIGSRLHRPLPTNAKLLEFLKQLPPEQRNRIESLPTRQQMFEELRRLYVRRQLPAWGRPRHGPPPGLPRRPPSEAGSKPGEKRPLSSDRSR
ncbi:MAG TPA: hypothetical protein ENJ16_00765 [Planctomycetaceae bacterium]|nr:hypothetical protein [Planctomycetaceae bacterium]